MIERSLEWMKATNSYLHALQLMIDQVCETKVCRSLLDDEHVRNFILWAFEDEKLDLAIHTVNITLSSSKTSELFKALSANSLIASIAMRLDVKHENFSLNYREFDSREVSIRSDQWDECQALIIVFAADSGYDALLSFSMLRNHSKFSRRRSKGFFFSNFKTHWTWHYATAFSSELSSIIVLIAQMGKELQNMREFDKDERSDWSIEHNEVQL